MMDPVWILMAFVFGMLVSQVGLPPLVGYLIAGFVLNGLGIHGGDVLEAIADKGVTLLLFSIGLKLKLKSLARPEVWAGAILHALITVTVFGLVLYLLGRSGMFLLNTLDMTLALLVGFALSFSSTVFAVKILEAQKEMAARHGGVAIGILIMQDIVAVVFLTISTGNIPSAWAIVLIASLFLLRPLLIALLNRCGHDELLLLFGLLLAFVGVTSFQMVGLKSDLGALVFGMLIASHPKASELAKSLLSFKDLFLVGFFLNIGMSGLPSLSHVLIAALLVVLLPFKVALFFALLTRFKLRARTSMLTAFSLANYSEFGLIVGAICVRNGWIGSEWLVVIAIALSATFIMAAPLNTKAHLFYSRWSGRLKRFETAERLADEQPIDPGRAEVAILGMGRIGTSAYDIMRRRYGEVVVGIDFDAETVAKHQAKGRNVVQGDATDYDFWERIAPGKVGVQAVMLAMPNHSANLTATRFLVKVGYDGLILATAQYNDEIEALEKAGVHAAYNFYGEAGIGFADHVSQQLERRGYNEKRSQPEI